MKEDKTNMLDTFGLGTITKVTNEMRPILKGSNSKSVIAIHLGQLYRELNEKEKLCMLNILHNIYDGTYQVVIGLMNIKAEDKLNYLTKKA